MGGGDLNMKKSWHPTIRKNQERVWEAEQKRDAELKRVEEFKKEIESERAQEEMQRFIDQSSNKKRTERLEWMYKGAVGNSNSDLESNREEYLLGKPIDRHVDVLIQDKERKEETASRGDGALFINQNTTNFARDMAAKINDDPLFSIKQKEIEMKQLILNNPLKRIKLIKLLERKQKQTSPREYISSKSGNLRKTLKSGRTKEKINKTNKKGQLHDSTNHHAVSDSDVEMSSHSDKLTTAAKHPNLKHKVSTSNQLHSAHNAELHKPATNRNKCSNNNYYGRTFSSGCKRLHSSHKKHSSEELERRRQEMLFDGSARKQDLKSRVRIMREKLQADEDLDRTNTYKYGYSHQLRQDSLNFYGALDDSIKRVKYKVQRNDRFLEDNYFMKK